MDKRRNHRGLSDGPLSSAMRSIPERSGRSPAVGGFRPAVAAFHTAMSPQDFLGIIFGKGAQISAHAS